MTATGLFQHTLQKCKATLEKPGFSKKDEIQLLKAIGQCIESYENVDERRKIANDLLDRVKEFLLIKKYRIIYKQAVNDGADFFDSTSLLEKFRETSAKYQINDVLK